MFCSSDVGDREMVTESKRLATFKKWKHKTGPLAAANMAKAGFYSTSKEKDSDCVRCFCCFKDLENWDDDDDPWHEHRKRNKCLFAKLGKEEKDLTLAQTLEVLEERLRNLNEKRDEAFQSLRKAFDECAAED